MRAHSLLSKSSSQAASAWPAGVPESPGDPPRCLVVRAGGTLVQRLVGSILASDDRLGLDKSEALVKAPRGIVGGLCRVRVLMDERG